MIRSKFVFAVCVAALVALLLPTAALAAPVLADSFPVSNFVAGTDVEYIDGANPASGQSFTAIAGTVDSASFYLKNAGSTDSVWAEVYNITGTPGSTAIPAGVPIASSAHINASTISGSSFNLVPFAFNNSVTLTSGSKYAVVVRRDGSSGTIRIGTSPLGTHTAVGNNMSWAVPGGWMPTTQYDMIFYVYQTPPAPVVSTPASSPWSLALAAVAALGLMVAVPAVRRRFAGTKA
jgi:hypothetical protein